MTREMKGEYVCIIFDSTSRLGEALNIISRWCPDDFSAIMKRLVAFVTTAQHMTGKQMKALFTKIIMKQRDIDPEMVVMFARDSVKVNGTLCNALTSGNFEAARDTWIFNPARPLWPWTSGRPDYWIISDR